MRTITAMYDSRSDAEDAMERLVSAGVARQDVSLMQQETGTATDVGDTSSTRESGGFLDSLANLFLPDEDRSTYSEGVRRGGVLLTARVDDDRIDEAVDVLESSSAVDVDSRAEEWRSSGWQGGVASTGAAAGAGVAGYGAGLSEGSSTMGYAPGATGSTTTTTTTSSSRDYGTGGSDRGVMERTGDAIGDAAEAVGLKNDDRDESRRGYAPTLAAGTTTTTTTDRMATTDRTGMTGDEQSIPIIEEQLRVGKRETGRGSVRVRSYMVETPVEEQVSLRTERVTVDRRPVDRAVGTADLNAFQERTIELDERSEEAVVDKQARVVEEVVVGKESSDRVETVRDTVRRTEVEVDDERRTAGTTTGSTFVETDRVTSTDVDVDTTGTTRTPKTGGY